MHVVNVMAVSLDGKIGLFPFESDEQRRSYGFVSNEDKEFVRSQLEDCDAVITGAHSLRASQRAWSLKGRNNQFPDWYILSNKGLEPELGFWKQKELPRTIVSKQRLDLHEPNVRNLIYGSEDPVSVILDDLKLKAKTRVLLFGGGVVNRMFYEKRAVNELWITVCPIIVGRSDAPEFVNSGLSDPTLLKLISHKQQANHLFVNYKLEGSTTP